MTKISCIHCKRMFAKNKTTPTTQLHRHLKDCAIFLRAKAIQDNEKLTETQLGFARSDVDPAACPGLHDGKFDMEKMKESLAYWIMMHGHPFSIVEEEGFNLMQKWGMPEWIGISRIATRTYHVNVSEVEKKMAKSFVE